MKRTVTSILLLSIIGSSLPLSTTFAQTPTQQQINNAASAGVRQRFNPNAQIQGRNTISGIQFTGVSGAALGCVDAGGRIIKGISSLFPEKSTVINKSKIASKFNFAANVGAGGQSVPVTAPTGGNDNFQVIQEQLTKADKREACLNGVAYAVAKGMLSQITNRVLNWANNGFGGDPLYVPNIDTFLKRISDKHLNEFLKDIPRRDPIFGNALRSIITESTTGIRDGLVDVAMDTPEGRFYDEFQRDFSRGGWEIFLDPNSNPLSALFDATDELGEDIANEQQNTRDELQRNNGFLDMKFCVKYADEDEARACEDQDDYSACMSAIQSRASEGKGPECLEWESVTPGSVIASQVSEVTGSATRQLEQADEINEVLGAFFDQVLSNLMSKGLASLGDKRNKSFRFNSLGSSAVLGGSGQGADPNSGISALGFEEANGRTSFRDFDISRPQQMRLVLKAQYDYLNRLIDARVALNRIVPTLGALDYCVPGPNPTWQDGLNDNAETYFSSLQEVQKDSTFFNRLVQSIPLIGGLFGSGQSHTIAAADVSLFDKVSDSDVQISDTVFHERNRSTLAIFENVQRRYDEVITYYEANYTPTTLQNAFTAADPANASYATGFVNDTIAETSNLASYAVGSAELDEYYTETERDTREAIRELQSISDEVNTIVATAKTRYIAERAAAGDPVVMSCIDRAYVIDTTPIVPVARQESDAPSPFLNRFIEASQYFYTQL